MSAYPARSNTCLLAVSVLPPARVVYDVREPRQPGTCHQGCSHHRHASETNQAQRHRKSALAEVA